MKGLAGKVALITGGGGRIGAAVAERLAAEGVRVALGDLNLDAARAVADRLGGGALAIRFDAEDPASIAAMVAEAADAFGRIDVLHNNAALLDPAVLNRDTTAADIDIGTWDRTMDVNVRGYLIACQQVIPHMRRQGGGSIINTSSNAAAAGDLLRIAYGTSKGAIVTMTKYIATQFGRENIRCNAIMPGLILDEELEARVPHLAETTKRHLLLTRNGRPDDVAGLVAFFASDDAAFITGQVLSCDGGLVGHQPFFADMVEGSDYTI